MSDTPKKTCATCYAVKSCSIYRAAQEWMSPNYIMTDMFGCAWHSTPKEQAGRTTLTAKHKAEVTT